MKKLIIFDCDGVLIDSEHIANQIAAKFYTNIGYPLTAEESIKRFSGKNAKAVRQIIIDESGINIEDDFLQHKLSAILKTFEEKLKPLCHDLLLKISSYCDKYCIASSSSRERIHKSLLITNQMAFFPDEHIFTSQQVEHGKPAPDLFLFAGKQMEFEPSDCVVIEDSMPGIQAALSANMSVIGFLGGSHAQYDWYQYRIKSFNIPVAYNTEDLTNILRII